ncbi:MAG TPA: hypothetical protein VMU57_17010 [Edaphobacter sp.]|uniref:hypothetical protein n=1 Tax=Edaphobacter sp. TaxID=1934404 RepID=UPI002C9F9C9E|nr:hypothetical protein [Edaphobacter sp.]HUZ96603.1 hypothetical protein [Edaphobacter sp.]
MTVAEFRAAEGGEFTGALLALWWDARGDWQKAHEIAQEVPGADGAWAHAYLHRKEGDTGNAAYWYRRAGRPVAGGDLPGEWEQIVREMLARG